MIIFCITYAHGFVPREPELAQRMLEAAGLVDASWQDHDRTTIADHLGLDAQLPDHVLYGRAVRLEGRHDHLADLQRRHRSLSKRFQESLGRRVREDALAARTGVVEQGAIFGD